MGGKRHPAVELIANVLGDKFPPKDLFKYM